MREKRKKVYPLVKFLNSWYEANDNLYVSININPDHYAQHRRSEYCNELYYKITDLIWKKLGVKLLHIVSYKWWYITADEVLDIIWHNYYFNS